MIMLLYFSFQKASQLDHCISCIFKKQNNKNGLKIQISQLCKSKISSKIEVMFQNETILKSELKAKQDNITLNIDQTDNITVVVKHEGVKYIFYKRQAQTNSIKKNYILIIVFMVVGLLIISFIVMALIIKKRKAKMKNMSVFIVTPKNTADNNTRIECQ
ncbi:Hypothetical_protein [Hexamita inflata]|uniref:Hypothetical_protein n=1 Tax=Hexamita inflata TaxID=28002 RepID=A0AA86RUZ5_9EUKA|nr:Hypothetical protein HINF_LOCUS65994 [Hexamita inflata]